MNLYGTATLICGTAIPVFGILLLLHEEGSRASVSFFLLTLAASFWFLGAAGMAAAPDPGMAARWARTAYMGVPFIPPATYHFTTRVLGVDRRRRGLVRAGWIVGGAFAVMTTFTDWMMSGVHSFAWGYFTRLEPAAILLVAFFAFYLSASLYEYRSSLRGAADSSERRRVAWIALSMAVSFLAVVDFLPSFGVDVFPFGFVPVTLGLLLLAWTARRYPLSALTPTFAADPIVRTMADPLLVCDRDRVIRYANPAACGLLGRDGLVGRPVEELAEGGPSGRERLRRILERESVRGEELVLRGAEGAPVSVSLSTSRIPGRAAPYRGTVLIARDVGERQEAARALAESEQRYRSLFYHNPDAVYGIGLDGRFESLNPATERLTGYAPSELEGESFEPLIVPEDREEARGIFEDVLRGVAREYELGLIRRDGERREVRGVSVPILVDGRVSGVFGIAADVTDERRAERAALRERSYLASLFDASPDALAILDEDDRIQRVNDAFTRLFGYSAGEAVGRRAADLLAPPGLRREGRDFSRRVARGEPLAVETVRRRKDGTFVEVSIVGHRVRLAGETDQLYGIYRDISERKRSEARLRETQEQLQGAQRMEAVGRLAGGIAHDFNNLLTVISGHAQLLLTDLPDDGPLRADLGEIERAAERAASLTRQLLAFSSRQALQPRPLDLNEVVRDTETMLRRVTGERVDVDLRLAPDLVPVTADPTQVEQVLLNLVINARDAMPEGGRLEIATRNERLGDAAFPELGFEPRPGRYAVLEVRDSGEGMDEETLARAFEPFFTTKEQGKGTGLGLSTVFGIVKQSDGYIHARSEAGEGAAFTLFFPEREEGRELREPARRDDVPPSRGEKVLVVEDEPSVRGLAIRVLRRGGYEVLEADSGEAGLRVLETGGPVDLLLTDVVMPGMGGRDLAQRFREAHPGGRVLLMSAYDPEGLADGGNGTEPLPFLPKPFTPETLALKVREVLADGPAAPAGAERPADDAQPPR